MNTISRRHCLQIGMSVGAMGGLFAPSAWAASKKSRPMTCPIGVTDWNLGLGGKVEAIALAKALGFDGVQVSIGRGTSSLPLADPALQRSYHDASERHGLTVASLCLDILHKNVLKDPNDPLGPRWVADSIGIARAMNVNVVLLPFFGRGGLHTTEEMDRVGDILREIAPAAAKAGVVLGLEDTISARDNVRIMERSRSAAVQTYYDVGESREAGFNVLQEIRWLGRPRICEVHLKDNPHYMGEGAIDFPAVVDALAEIGFNAWAQLEADRVSKDLEADMRRNLAFIRTVISAHNRRS